VPALGEARVPEGMLLSFVDSLETVIDLNGCRNSSHAPELVTCDVRGQWGRCWCWACTVPSTIASVPPGVEI
jgi:hypothetical protein